MLTLVKGMDPKRIKESIQQKRLVVNEAED